jgi:hypothetical protein
MQLYVLFQFILFLCVVDSVYCKFVEYKSCHTESVWQLATGWKVRGSNPGGGEIFLLIQTGSEAHPASCTMGTGAFPGVKAAGRGVDHAHLSGAEVNEKG